MKKKALSDTLIKRIAGTLPSGRVLLKGKKKDGGAGKHKGNDEGLQGDGAIDILAAFRFTETAWSFTRRKFSLG